MHVYIVFDYRIHESFPSIMKIFSADLQSEAIQYAREVSEGSGYKEFVFRDLSGSIISRWTDDFGDSVYVKSCSVVSQPSEITRTVQIPLVDTSSGAVAADAAIGVM